MPDLRQDAVTEWLTALDPADDRDHWPPAVRALETEADAPELFEDVGHLLDQFGPGETEMLATALRSPRSRPSCARHSPRPVPAVSSASSTGSATSAPSPSRTSWWRR